MRAYKTADPEGTGLVSIPKSEEKSILYINCKHGKHNPNPKIIAGTTNNIAYTMIIIIIPFLLRPIILMTPISKVLDSTDTISKE